MWRYPSPALIVSIVALVFAVGGVGYAAVKITGKDVKNRSLTGKDVKRDSLRGRQIRESSLAKVPRAARADRAAQADSAGSALTAQQLGGIGPGGFVQGEGSIIDARLELADGQVNTNLISIPGVASVTARCTNAADDVNTTLRNDSAEEVFRVTNELVEAASQTTAGILVPGDDTSTTSLGTGSNQGHVHTYFSMPVDGTGPSAEIRIATAASPKGEARCVFIALATSVP
jgi:hypothetical protein